MSKFVGTGLWSYEKRIYRAVVSQRLRNTGLDSWVINIPFVKMLFSPKKKNFASLYIF